MERLKKGMPRKQAVLLVLFLACAAAFLGLSVFVSFHPSNSFDLSFKQMFSRRPPAVRRLMTQMDGVVSPKHDLLAAGMLSVMLVSGGAVLHALRRTVRDAILFSGTTSVSFFLSLALKSVFARVRPDLSAGFSFPSDHAVMAFAFFIPLACIVAGKARSKAARALCWSTGAALTAVVGISRLVAEKHFVTDVIAGYLLSAAVFLLFLFVLGFVGRSEDG